MLDLEIDGYNQKLYLIEPDNILCVDGWSQIVKSAKRVCFMWSPKSKKDKGSIKKWSGLKSRSFSIEINPFKMFYNESTLISCLKDAVYEGEAVNKSEHHESVTTPRLSSYSKNEVESRCRKIRNRHKELPLCLVLSNKRYFAFRI